MCEVCSIWPGVVCSDSIVCSTSYMISGTCYGIMVHSIHPFNDKLEIEGLSLGWKPQVSIVFKTYIHNNLGGWWLKESFWILTWGAGCSFDVAGTMLQYDMN